MNIEEINDLISKLTRYRDCRKAVKHYEKLLKKDSIIQLKVSINGATDVSESAVGYKLYPQEIMTTKEHPKLITQILETLLEDQKEKLEKAKKDLKL